jgi:hypothetical protein
MAAINHSRLENSGRFKKKFNGASSNTHQTSSSRFIIATTRPITVSAMDKLDVAAGEGVFSTCSTPSRSTK